MSKFRQILTEVMSQVPETKDSDDLELLFLAIIAELDAINLYKKFSELAKDPDIKKVLLDIAKEEKHHVHEFLLLIEGRDSEWLDQKREAIKELKDMGVY